MSNTPIPRKPPAKATKIRPEREPNPVTRFIDDEEWIRMNEKKVAHRVYSFRKSYGWSYAAGEELAADLNYKLTKMPQEIRADPDYYDKWIATCLNNCARDHRDQYGRWDNKHLAMSEEDIRTRSVPDASAQIHSDLAVQKLFSVLTERQQILIDAHLGLSQKAVNDHRRLAHLAGMPQKAVAAELEKALAAMRELLTGEPAQEDEAAAA
jgi:DNA-directed RNA polymerase specialized sigma24 family protein